jgi:hypothetical protein
LNCWDAYPALLDDAALTASKLYIVFRSARGRTGDRADQYRGPALITIGVWSADDDYGTARVVDDALLFGDQADAVVFN